MALMISGISLPFETPEEQAIQTARQILGQAYSPKRAYVVKKAVDARRQDDIRFVYTVGAELEGDESDAAERIGRPNVAAKPKRELAVARGSEKLETRPVVAGFGPGGMFAALLLARQGLRPIVLERGADVDTRAAQVEAFWSTGALNEESNVQFGEGGAGTFSDGKLLTRIGDERCAYILEALVAHGAPGEVLYQAKPHVGTDLLRGVVKSIREEILCLGGEVLFHTRLTGLQLQDGRLRGVSTTGGDFRAEALILAPGHSARDLFETLKEQGVPIQPKAFSVGLRIEHRQEWIDRALYGEHAGHPLLPKGEYQLSHREGGRAVYSFCMCPGGVVVPAASESGMVATNGMSQHRRDGENANAALAVSVDMHDFGFSAMDGVEFQRRLETAAFLAGGGGYRAPAQTVGRFLEEKPGAVFDRVTPSYARGVTGVDFSDLLPAFVTEFLRAGVRRFGRKLAGFDAPDAVLTGIESRTSSPVRIPRGEDLCAQGVAGLYPCAEGAGYAGGIVSAAVDGLRCAQALLAKFG